MNDHEHPGSGQGADEYSTAGLAEEIRLLVDLVIERAAPWLEGVLAAGHGAEDAAAHTGPAVGRGDCEWCPLCAIVAVVRGQRPEIVAKVLEQAAALVALLRAVLADRWDPEYGVHMPGFRPAPQPADAADVADVAVPEPASPGTESPPAEHGEPGTSRVQHIPVRRSPQWHTRPRGEA